MDAERLSFLLKNPDQLAKVSYQEIKRVVLQYPYCQNLRLILLQKSQQEQNQELNQNIQWAAAFSNDRSHFYQFFQASGGSKETMDPYQLAETFLEENPPTNTPEEEIPAASANPALEDLVLKEAMTFDLSDPNIEDITHEINLQNFSSMEDDDSKNFDLDEHLKNFREEKIEPDSSREPPSFKEKGENLFFLEDLIEDSPGEEEALLEENIDGEVPDENMEAIESSLDLPEEVLIEEPKLEIPVETVEEFVVEEIDEMPKQSIPIPLEEGDKSILEEIPGQFSGEEAELVGEEELPTADQEVALEEPSAPSDIPLEITNLPEEEEMSALPKPVPKESFSSWLRQFQSPQVKVNLAAEKTSPPIPKEVPPSPAVKLEPEIPLPPVEIPEVPKKEKPIRLDDLIGNKKAKSEKKKKVKALSDLKKAEKAAKKASKAGKKNKKQGKIINFAAQSLNEDEEIVSETLAGILARQGAYDKAIRIYERLKLIYPEKSAYFASEIADLKKRLL